MISLAKVIPLVLLAGVLPAVALADSKLDVQMKQLAARSGCVACHTIQPGEASPDGTKPVGPAWADVAARYQGQKGAADKLLHTVMEGSNPYASHWKGKVSGLAMPPNAVAIKEVDARKLVKWILALKE